MTATERLRILMVDDEPVLCKGVARALDGFLVEVPDADLLLSFELASAGSGEECLERIRAQRPDILLIDYKLPQMTGLDVLDQIEPALKKEMLVVMVTAYANIETAIRATKLGAYDFLAKPFNPEELRSVVRKTARHLVLARRARQLEEEKRKIRFEFLSVLAHELKAPINAVDGYLELLRERLTDPEDRHMVERSVIRLDGMRKLIFDLLDLTRIESGQKKRVIAETDLVPLIQAAIEAVNLDARERKIEVSLKASGRIKLQADAGEMEIIFNNLISNAVKYNRDGGRVDVQLSREGDVVTFLVSDTGIGLTPDEKKQLFGEFVRIRNESTKQIPGSGLGLSTVQKLARMYGGEVRVDSERGVGSTFTVLLRDGAQK